MPKPADESTGSVPQAARESAAATPDAAFIAPETDVQASDAKVGS